MKQTNIGLLSMRMGLMGVVLVCLLLFSCSKSSDNNVQPPTAIMTVIQASPDEPALDFYLNGERANAQPLTYGTGINYFSAIAGDRTGFFYNTGTFTPVVATAQFTLQANMAYSLFLDNTAAKPQILVLTDTLIKPAAGNAGVRFVDLSPDAPAVDLVIQGGETITSNKSFQGYSSFVPISTKANINLQVVKASTNTVLATLSSANLTAGNLYTVMFEGLNTPLNNTDGLNIIMITNAYFTN